MVVNEEVEDNISVLNYPAHEEPKLCKHLLKNPNREYVGIEFDNKVRWDCLKCTLRAIVKGRYPETYLFKPLYVDNLSHASKLKIRVAIEAAIDRESAHKALSSESGSYYVEPEVTHAATSN
jgi:hypothetical protein